MSRNVWCVKSRYGWCATKYGRRPSPDAIHDETRCGAVVTLRLDSAKCEPDCAECRQRMRLPSLVRQKDERLSELRAENKRLRERLAALVEALDTMGSHNAAQAWKRVDAATTHAKEALNAKS